MRHLNLKLAPGVVCSLLALTSAAGAFGGSELASVSAGGGRIDFQPAASYERMVLTVATPDGAVLRREFAGGGSPFFELGVASPDGAYTWELRAEPQLSTEQRRRLAAARRGGAEGAAAAQRALGLDPDRLVQSGGFQVLGGQIVTGGSEPEGRRAVTAPGKTNITAADQVIPDDVIVQGSECVGLDCVNNEDFGFDTIRLKENNLRIHFDDTSFQAGFSANDWRIIANDSPAGGQSKFSIEDSTAARTPFSIIGGATTNSLFVSSTGRVGFRTATPVLDLHVNTTDTPALRFEQNNTGGFTAQTWDVAGNEANFFVRDVTSGSRLPFRIRPGAPTSSLDIAANGQVGMGTGTPEATLHVFGAANDDVFLGIGADPADNTPGETAFNFGYSGNSFGVGSGFFNVRPEGAAVAPNPSLRFATANAHRMILDNQGFLGLGDAAFNPSNPIHHQATNARLDNAGIWQNGSSRAMKQGVRELGIAEALAALDGLQPVRYFHHAVAGDEYLGFIAEDVPELVATEDRQTLGSLDLIAVLTRVVQDQQRRIAALEERLRAREEPE